MKQSFTIVVDHKEPLNELQISMILQAGLFDFYYNDRDKISIVKTTKQNVEQNHGTPKSIDKNALDLLRRASDSFKGLAPHCEEEILGEIEDYLELIKDKQ